MECEKIGLNYAVKLSYAAIDKSTLRHNEKRNLLFSVYSFRSLFDNKEMLYLNPMLKKYSCSFEVPLDEHPSYPQNKEEIEAAVFAGGAPLQNGGIVVKSGDVFKLKFDAGSGLFYHFLNKGIIAEAAKSIPEKYSLYETVYKIITLKNATDELKALWFLIFPYIITIDAPHEPEYYYKIRELLFTENVFESVLESRFSFNTADSVQELWALDVPNLVVDFMLPFIEWKSTKNEKGVSKDVERFQKWLAQGRFYDVFAGSEKLLDTFPDDEDLLLVNIASRISLDKEISKDDREKLLNDTLNLLDDILSAPVNKKTYFLYYYGLALLGLRRIDEAVDKFNECLEINPSFDSAKTMLKIISEKFNK